MFTPDERSHSNRRLTATNRCIFVTGFICITGFVGSSVVCRQNFGCGFFRHQYVFREIVLPVKCGMITPGIDGRGEAAHRSTRKVRDDENGKDGKSGHRQRDGYGRAGQVLHEPLPAVPVLRGYRASHPPLAPSPVRHEDMGPEPPQQADIRHDRRTVQPNEHFFLIREKFHLDVNQDEGRQHGDGEENHRTEQGPGTPPPIRVRELVGEGQGEQKAERCAFLSFERKASVDLRYVSADFS